MAAAAGAAAQLRHAQIRFVDRVWSAYATARGMHYRAGREGWARTEVPRLDGAIGKIAVALELDVGALSPTVLVVNAMARPVIPLAGHVEATHEGILSRIAELFGARDVVLGDEPFDGAFVVKATDERTARVLLPQSVTSELVELGAGWFAYDDGTENSYGAVIAASFPLQGEGFAQIDRVFALVARVAQLRPDDGPYR